MPRAKTIFFSIVIAMNIGQATESLWFAFAAYFFCSGLFERLDDLKNK